MTGTIDLNKFSRYNSLEFIAKQVVEGYITGLHKSPFHGFSVEFSEHRQYNSGESTKNIDWKLFGRTDKLYVKRYEEETNLRCQIIIDVSSSMYYPLSNDISIDKPNKLLFSIYASAAIMYLLRKQRDAFGLTLFADNVELHTSTRSTPMHHKYLIQQMEVLLKQDVINNPKNTRAVETLHLTAEKIHKRSLVIIFSDMFDTVSDIEKIFSALQHLKHNKHEIILFHVIYAKKELDFDFQNRPYKFVDMESGKEVKVNPHEIRSAYVTSATNYINELKLKCAQYQVDFVEADINKGFDQILLPYLLKRNKMF